LLILKKNCSQYLIISRTKIEYNNGTKTDPKRRYRQSPVIVF